MLLGAGTYWIPDLVIQLIKPPQGIWILLLTFLVPVICYASSYYFSKIEIFKQKYRASVPLFMLLGVWVFGPIEITAFNIANGGNFGDLQDFLFLCLIFPASTFMMATYSGSLGGIGLITVLLIARAIAVAITAKKNIQEEKLTFEQKLKLFDPALHGGEVMAVKPLAAESIK
jgi:hypothetical protein